MSNSLSWAVFGVVILVMLALDLGVFHRREHEVKIKEALIWSGIWIAVALLFNWGGVFSQGEGTCDAIPCRLCSGTDPEL